MLQFAQNDLCFKEKLSRPISINQRNKKALLMHSTTNIISTYRTQKQLKIEANNQDQVSTGVSLRKSFGQVCKAQYMHVRLMKRKATNTPQPFTVKIQDMQREESSQKNILLVKARKERGVSLGKAINLNTRTQKEQQRRPGTSPVIGQRGIGATSQTLGQKGAYFDQFLSNPQILKNFKIMSHIGKGAFSVVSLAIDRQTKKNFAIKAYQKIDNLDWNRLACIKRQIRNLQNMNHDRVVKLVGLVKQRKRLYLIMENGGRQSLGGIVRKERFLIEQQAKRYFRQLLEGMAYIHQAGICHRDLKPQNILIDDNGFIKIIDFGFSTSSKITLNNFCGTPAYMSPQIVKKTPYNGAKADIWALGIILYLMLIGNFPFRASNQHQLNRLIMNGRYRYRDQGAISESAKRFISRMIQVKPEDRPNAIDLLQDNWLL